MQVLLQSGRFKIASELTFASTLTQELLAFRVKIDVSGHDTYGVLREGGHDDLRLACAVACWVGERDKPRDYSLEAWGLAGPAKLRDWLERAPGGTMLPAAEVLAQLNHGEVGAPNYSRADHAAPVSWRERLWTCPPETRLGVAELAEALNRPKSWVHRHTSQKSGVPCFRIANLRARSTSSPQKSAPGSPSTSNAVPNPNRRRLS
ncbi:MAG: hypothetical protein ACT4P6_10635 [Gemmatimonadaceae bacterium]